MKILYNLEYFISNKSQKIAFENEFENDDLLINTNFFQNSFELHISSIKTITLKSLIAEIDYKFDSDSKIFVNGFQSWTDSNEYSINDIMNHMSLFPKILNPLFKFKQYGDYKLYKHDSYKGDFYGFGLAYIRKGDNYFLLASNNENFAHTIFRFCCSENKIRFIIDCLDVEIEEPTKLIDISVYKGNEEVLKIFNKTKITDKKIKCLTGWTSWYNYYQNINEKIILHNLEQFKEYYPKYSIFQIDDGYQTAVGDWLDIDKIKFPNGLKNIVDKIHSNNYQAGLWLAPFAAQKNSKLATEHPEWILKDKNGNKIQGGMNWGGFYAIDFYKEGFQDYLRNVFKVVLEQWEFDLVKLDFLYTVQLIPQNGNSRAKVLSEAMDFLREVVGNKKILACGVPLAQAFNKVDYCRIGCDISLDWNGKFYEKWLHRERISTYNSIKNTVFRHFLDKVVFLNDPDVFLLRDDNINLTKNQRITLFLINTIFGSLVFTSDDFSEYGEWQKKLLSNLDFFHKAKVLSKNLENDILTFIFETKAKIFKGISNLTSNVINKTDLSSEYFDIFELKLIPDDKPGQIQPYETKIYSA